MANRFTYKDLTLLIGVVIALIAVLTLWLRLPGETPTKTSKRPVISIYQKTKHITLKNFTSVFEELATSRNNPY